MFVMSFKPSGKRFYIFVCVVIFITVMLFGIGLMRRSQPCLSAVCDKGEYSLSAENNAQRLEFFGQFGWKTEEKPLRHEKITIPKNFGDVYKNYNEIQKSQGLNLEKHKGEECEVYSYKILNHESSTDAVINIIVHDGAVIGGDVSSAAIDGFMTGFYKE